jgi:hypothetical protein
VSGRRVLGVEEFVRTYAIGAALSFEQAVDSALGSSDRRDVARRPRLHPSRVDGE